MGLMSETLSLLARLGLAFTLDVLLACFLLAVGGGGVATESCSSIQWINVRVR